MPATMGAKAMMFLVCSMIPQDDPRWPANAKQPSPRAALHGCWPLAALAMHMGEPCSNAQETKATACQQRYLYSQPELSPTTTPARYAIPGLLCQRADVTDLDEDHEP